MQAAPCIGAVFVCMQGQSSAHSERNRRKIFQISAKTIDKGLAGLYNNPKSGHDIGSGKEEHSMRYAAISENMMMDMGMCQMCMRTLRYAQNSEPVSVQG